MIRRLSRKLFTLEQWSVGWAKVGIDRFLADPSAVDLQWMKPRSARELIADPFGLEDNGELVIFAEQLVYGESVGQIMRFGADAPFHRESLLRQPWHLSYPFVVEDAGRRFIVPEQSQVGALAFYPYSSSGLGDPAAVIDDFDAVDPTFLYHDRRWWLFCTHRRGPNCPLYLYFSDRLFGPYQPHPMNPVVRDPSRARPAGGIIRSTDALLRPAQDCSKSYGAALVICQIEALSAHEYSERPVKRIEPQQLRGGFSEGVHTLNHTDHYVMLNSKRFARSLSAPSIKIAGIAKRLTRRRTDASPDLSRRA